MDDNTHLVDNYEDGDEIYCFGFSRGAFTVRTLLGLIKHFGILKKNGYGSNLNSEGEIEKSYYDATTINAVYELYRSMGCRDASGLPLGIGQSFFPVPIAFLGAFDTVKALSAGSEFHDVELHADIKMARHALAIDEQRIDFKPEMWEPLPKADGSSGIRNVEGPYKILAFANFEVDDMRALENLVLSLPADQIDLSPDVIEKIKQFEQLKIGARYKKALFTPSDVTKIKSFLEKNDQTNLSVKLVSDIPPHSQQRWFVGVHADIGGGYGGGEEKGRGLANVALHWMLAEASQLGIAYNEDLLALYAPAPISGEIHDELATEGDNAFGATPAPYKKPVRMIDGSQKEGYGLTNIYKVRGRVYRHICASDSPLNHSYYPPESQGRWYGIPNTHTFGIAQQCKFTDTVLAPEAKKRLENMSRGRNDEHLYICEALFEPVLGKRLNLIETEAKKRIKPVEKLNGILLPGMFPRAREAASATAGESKEAHGAVPGSSTT